MNALIEDPQALRGAMHYAVPLFYGLAALSTARLLRIRPDPWRIAGVASTAALIVALLSLAGFFTFGALTVQAPALLHFGSLAVLSGSTHSDFAGSLVLALVAFIGWVLVRFSRRYMHGDPDQPRFVGGLAATLAGAATVVLTNDLAVLALAWFAASVALHRLLTFFPQRIPALVAAHKKFLISRFADLCMFGAVVLIAQSLGTLAIDELTRLAHLHSAMPTGVHAALVLIVIAALLKCAQLPTHGWLIQVMEAPTPVSALLHAGVVNLGGFVLIRLSALLADVPAAQALLVVVGTSTAVVAALVMLTRISVKVMLAWSTCAQMGFMLMQCGLGAYDLALLHLLAHSLYKAHAFLGAGGAVEAARTQALLAPITPSLAPRIGSALAGVATVSAVAALWQAVSPLTPAVWVLASVLCLALTPLLERTRPSPGKGWLLRSLLMATSLAVVYFALHALFAFWLPPGLPPNNIPQPLLLTFVVVCFGGLFIAQTAIDTRPQGAFARAAHPWFYSGFFLDELFTRATFRVWPVPTVASSHNGSHAASALATQEHTA